MYHLNYSKMKKIVLTLLVCFTALGVARAQENAVGLRFGGSAELLYQRDLSRTNFLQFTLAIPDYDGFAVTGLYNWRLCQWDWTPETCDWHLNAGVGGALGMYNFDKAGFMLGVTGSCAFGCQFKSVPISIDIDYRPVLGAVIGGNSKGFFKPGLWNFGLAVAYHF